jgi:hypothetical protein
MKTKRKPVAMSARDVSAIRRGVKTMFRAPVDLAGRSRPPKPPTLESRKWTQDVEGDLKRRSAEPPYGVPGDVLWVKEPWAALAKHDHLPPLLLPRNEKIFYLADEEDMPEIGAARTPLQMPRWASRISLRVCGVRIERLQDISDADLLAEGCEIDYAGEASEWYRRSAYSALWDVRYGQGAAWLSNPWVWVIEFKRIDQK